MIKSEKNLKSSLMKKFSVCFFMVWLVIGIVIAGISYYNTKRHMFELVSKTANNCAIDTAKMLHGAPLDDFLQGKEKKLYNSYLGAIKSMTETFNLRYLYVYIPDEKNNRLISVFGIDGNTGNFIKGFQPGESPKDVQLNPKVVQLYKTNGKHLVLEMNNKFGHVVTGYSTVTDRNGKPIAISGADIDFDYLQKKIIDDIVKTFSVMFLMLSIVYFFLIFYFKRTFIKPILTLSRAMKNFVKHDGFWYNPIVLNTNDEFNIMADSYNSMARSIKTYMKELSDSQTETIFSLAKLIQTRDDSTGKHIERVQAYCKILSIGVMLAKLYPRIVNKKFIRNLVNASPLHDIGKVAIADILLLNPQKLTEEEITKMQMHTVYGEQALAKVHSRFGNNDFIGTGMLIARSHHEKWDGSGYPDHLKGEQIPLAARILAIADVYDALATKRVYKQPFSHSKCVQIILAAKGTHFDPQLVDIFMQIEYKFLKIRQSFEKIEML